MARPKSEDKRDAILAAAIRVIATQGLSAPTALIAKEAGVASGSLFNYFPTKADLLNALYLELKAEMAFVALDGLPPGDDVRQQVLHMWSHWLHWAASYPERRKTLTHLDLSADISAASHQTASQALAGIAKLLERSRENGPMRNVPLAFVMALVHATADATIDFMIRDPGNAVTHCAAGFDAVWRMIA